MVPMTGGCALGRRRVSRHRPLSVFAAAYLNRLRDRRMVEDAERIRRDIAGSVVGRWRETEERTDALIKMTRTLARLTWALLILTIGTLGSGLGVGAGLVVGSIATVATVGGSFDRTRLAHPRDAAVHAGVDPAARPLPSCPLTTCPGNSRRVRPV
jgi:hypothetical protein